MSLISFFEASSTSAVIRRGEGPSKGEVAFEGHACAVSVGGVRDESGARGGAGRASCRNISWQGVLADVENRLRKLTFLVVRYE